MNEISEFKRLAKKIKNNKEFQKRNISELIKIIPFIGSLIEENIFGPERDANLESRFIALEDLASKALMKEDVSKIINVLEQHTLILNRFVFENENLLLENANELKRVKVGISFVEQDINLAKSIIKQLKKNQIDVVSNNLKFADENKISYNEFLPPTVDSLIVLYSSNYENHNSSSYNKNTYLNKGIELKTPITTIAFNEITNSKLPIENSLKKVFHSNEVSDIIDTFFFDNYIELKEKEQDLITKYSDVETILKLYNSNFNKIESYEKNKIGFELYELKNLTGSSIFCVYLYENIYIKNTLKFIHNNCIKNSEEYFILVQKTKRYDQEKRIDYLKKHARKNTNAYYIDDFIWENLTSSYFETKQTYTNTSFIPPNLLYQKKTFDNFNFFDNWLYKKNSPTLIITGSGGIGKTTLAKELTNRINNSANKTKAIYIDALKISSSILHLTHNNDNINLYSFYESSVSKNSTPSLSYDLFRINIDNGNLVVIIDGLDEIISRLGERFNISNFFETIQNFTDGVGNGKVILTSRNHFWNISKSFFSNSQEIEILPFNKDKALEYFDNLYPNSPKLVKKAMRISESILGDISNNDFIPYVLECVSFIIEDSTESGKYYDPDFNSTILRQDIKNDFILGKLCVREEQRTEQIDVDQQLEIFYEIANKNIQKDEFHSACKRISKIDINDRQIETFLSHPIIDSSNDNVKFKYDFFKNHIKSIYLNNLFNINDLSINENHIDIFSNLISFNSSFTLDISERINIEKEDLMYRFLVLQEEIKNKSEISTEAKNKSISSLFIILLKNNVHKYSYSSELNTQLLVEFFGKTNGTIDALNIIDLSCNDSNKIIFDFSNIKFDNAFISSYDYFWECKFNANTEFSNSYFYKVHKSKKINTSAKETNFINVKGSDETFKRVISESKFFNKNKDSKIISDLHQFFSHFCSNGIVDRKIYPRINQLYQRKYIKLDSLIKILEKENIIKTYSSPKNIVTIEILHEHHQDILKFYSNRISGGCIKEIFNVIKNK
ncbi:NACHT domain-containing protein [Aquimarina spinulae]|uniref:NACHT domain-containing protein n=1 Tax=Aquimarina spinulae TaxID=1192023 RepID=UPI000D55C15E|nr:NACHT domain-containing protein [Aquimarina spinulae]